MRVIYICFIFPDLKLTYPTTLPKTISKAPTPLVSSVRTLQITLPTNLNSSLRIAPSATNSSPKPSTLTVRQVTTVKTFHTYTAIQDSIGDFSLEMTYQKESSKEAFVCVPCENLKFTTYALLRKHLEDDHICGTVRSLFCNICARSIPANSYNHFQIPGHQNKCRMKLIVQHNKVQGHAPKRRINDVLETIQTEPKVSKILVYNFIYDYSTIKDQFITLLGAEDEGFFCNICEYQYSNLIDFKKHIDEAHQNILHLQCVECLHQVGSLYELENHVNYVHKSLEPTIKFKLFTEDSLDRKDNIVVKVEPVEDFKEEFETIIVTDENDFIEYDESLVVKQEIKEEEEEIELFEGFEEQEITIKTEEDVDL